MERDNERWVSELTGDKVVQQAALSDLRAGLVGGVRAALGAHGSRADWIVEDAVQEALIRILERLPQFEGRSRFLTWATAIAIRVAMSELRRRRWKDVSIDQVVARSDIVPPPPVDERPGPGKHLERRSIVAALYDLIHNDLTSKQRTALLAELGGMPQDEIARHLGSNRNAVYKLTHDARKRLKTGLQAAGYDAGDIGSAFAQQE